MLVAFNSLTGKPLDLSRRKIYKIDITRFTKDMDMCADFSAADGSVISVVPTSDGRWQTYIPGETTIWGGPSDKATIYENVDSVDYVGVRSDYGITELGDGQN